MMMVRADSAVSAHRPLPPSIKVLVHWMSGDGEWGEGCFRTGVHPLLPRRQGHSLCQQLWTSLKYGTKNINFCGLFYTKFNR